MKDDSITITELKEQVRLFCEQRDWDQFHNPKDLAIGISTESNELLDIFRFKTEEQVAGMFQDPAARRSIGEEIADVFYFLLRFCQMYGFDLSNELLNKLKINGKRYPVEKSRGSNQKHNEQED